MQKDELKQVGLGVLGWGLVPDIRTEHVSKRF